MRRSLWITLACAGITVGCSDNKAVRYDHQARSSELNTWMVDSYHDAAIRNAVIRQRTVFPHYFVPATATLTELGERDVGFLAQHLQQSPGAISIRRGDTDAQLYQQRIDAVRTALALGGVDPNNIQVGDALPAGDGVRANRVMVLAEEANYPSDITASEVNGDSVNTFTTTSLGTQP